MANRGLVRMTRKKGSLQMTRRYRRAGKKEKGKILDAFCALTGYNRSYAVFLLRNAGQRKVFHTPRGPRWRVVADPNRKIRREQAPTCGEEVRKVLWRMSLMRLNRFSREAICCPCTV